MSGIWQAFAAVLGFGVDISRPVYRPLSLLRGLYRAHRNRNGAAMPDGASDHVLAESA